MHVQEVWRALNQIPLHDASRILGGRRPAVLSLGGGPGSDIAAFRKWVGDIREERNTSSQIEINRLDRVTAWDEIAPHVYGPFRAQGVTFRHRWIHRDIACGAFTPAEPYGVVLISYLISELDADGIAALRQTLTTCTAPGSAIVINDRDEVRVTDTIGEIVRGLDCRIACDGENSVHWCGMSYPDNIKDAAKPKLKTSSSRFVAIRNQ